MNHKPLLKNITTIVKKELLSYVDNPASYVVLIVFQLLWLLMYFKNVFLIGEASLTSLFEMFPWFGLILVSAITMSAVAKEKDDGTLELVLTHPVREIEFVLAKVAGAMTFVTFALLFTLPIALSFVRFGPFDWGVYLSQLLGAWLFSLALVSLGVFLSSLFSSQIAALLTTLAAGFMLIVSGTPMITSSVPLSVAGILEKISLYSHFSSIIRGVVDLYDVLYFLSFVTVFLLLTLLQLLKRKYGDYKARYSILQVVALGLIGFIMILSTLRLWVPVRLDVTSSKIFTLSSKTKSILNKMEGPVELTLYASEELPSQYTPVFRDLKYTLSDYKSAAKNKISVTITDPSKSPDDEQKAAASGIQKIQFNLIGKEEVQIKTGYLGLVITAGEKSEVIPVINSTNDIEYQISSLIRKLTEKDKKQVNFLTGHEEKTTVEARYLSGELQKLFSVNASMLNDKVTEIDANVDTLIIAGPKVRYEDTAVQALKDHLSKGKNLVIMSESFEVDNSLMTSIKDVNVNSIIESLGVSINNDIVYDLKSYMRISFRDAYQTLVAPYPYWILSEMDKDNPLDLKYVKSVGLYWPSSLFVDEKSAESAGYVVKKIITTTDNGDSIGQDAVTANPGLYPSNQYPTVNPGTKVLGVALEPVAQESAPAKGRLVIIGDSDFIADDFLQRNPENLAFAAESITWAAGAESLADIQVKSSAFSTFKFADEALPNQIRYSTVGYAVVGPLLLGIVRFVKRRALRYEKPRI